MRPIDFGFTDELVKLSSSAEFTKEEIKQLFQDVKRRTNAKQDSGFFDRAGKKVSKGIDLATPAMMGGVASPALAILGLALKRKLHNREVKALMQGSKLPKQLKKQIASQVHQGPLISKSNINKSLYQRSITTPKDLAVDATKGLAIGTGYQLIRSRRKQD